MEEMWLHVLPDPASIRQMEQESSGLTERSYCYWLETVLTRERVQLFGEGSHNDVVLHDVRHLLLQVVLIEGDQGIRAGIPNLKKRFSLCLSSDSFPCPERW